MQQPKTSKYFDILTVNDNHKNPTTLYKTVETKQKIYFRAKKLMIITMIHACMERYPLSKLEKAANNNASIIKKIRNGFY